MSYFLPYVRHIMLTHISLYVHVGGGIMANLKSAIKRIRINETKRESNKSYKTKMRTQMKKVEALVEANDEENAQLAYREAVQLIDRAIQKKIIHKNNGNRHKARLAKKLRSISAS